MSIYDEIMAMHTPKYNSFSYIDGFVNAKREAAELAKKYDSEIEELKFTIKDLERKLKDDSFI